MLRTAAGVSSRRRAHPSGVQSKETGGQMKPMHRSRKRGQILVLMTFALFVMCGMLGLAVDVGWSYFVKKSA